MNHDRTDLLAGLSFFLVAISLTILLVTAIPAFHELARASRSVQKLSDVLIRELPPTLGRVISSGAHVTL